MTSAYDDSLPRLDHGLVDLADRYDLLFCDVWGVIHNGVSHHPLAVDALQRFRKRGGTVVLVTNAPAPARNVVGRLDSLGVPRDVCDAIATSGDVTAAMIAAAGCPPLFNLGPAHEVELYREAERLGPHKPRLVALDEAELVIGITLIESIGPDPRDYDGLLNQMRAKDLTMICANPDIVVEVGDDLIYCAGAIAERYEGMGGAVVQAGKPFAPIYDRAFALARDIVGDVPKDRVLAIGDAMHTDLRGAHGQGLDALFITSGIHRDALHGGLRGDPLDRAALRQFLGDGDIRPVAAMQVLAWSV